MGVTLLQGQKALSEDAKLYDLMKTSSEPLYLQLNDITYQLDNKAVDSSVNMDSDAKNPWFDYCKKQGFSNCSSATIGTIVNLLERNTPGEETSAQEQTDLFLKH